MAIRIKAFSKYDKVTTANSDGRLLRSCSIFFMFSVICSPILAGASEPTTEAIPHVEAMIAKMSRAALDIVIPGDIEARYQSNISFRVSGKISARYVDVGAHVVANEVLAKIAPEQQEADMRNAEAALASAEATLGQAKLTYARQAQLIKDRFTTGPTYDQAVQQLRTAEAQVQSSKAKVGSMKEKLSYTDLKAGVDGIVTARNAEVGKVVKEGDTIFTIAQDGPRDAVFNVYESLLVKPPKSNDIVITLTANPNVSTAATVREIAPTVDSKTGAVKLKAALKEQPPTMTLGASIIGKGRLDAPEAVVVPWSALYRWDGSPAVWIVDPKNGTVAPHVITIERYAGDGMVLKTGVAPGDHVVTAGVQFLRPGQKVKVVEGVTP